MGSNEMESTRRNCRKRISFTFTNASLNPNILNMYSINNDKFGRNKEIKHLIQVDGYIVSWLIFY